MNKWIYSILKINYPLAYIKTHSKLKLKYRFFPSIFNNSDATFLFINVIYYSRTKLLTEPKKSIEENESSCVYHAAFWPSFRRQANIFYPNTSVDWRMASYARCVSLPRGIIYAANSVGRGKRKTSLRASQTCAIVTPTATDVCPSFKILTFWPLTLGENGFFITL